MAENQPSKPAQPGSIPLPAYAKLNLSLRVGERSADGYHHINSLMVPLELADELTFQRHPGAGIDLLVAGPTAADTPTGRDNLCWRAAELLAASAGAAADVRMVLNKRIPVGGGLGGGSSDAAATLLGLSRLWGLGRSRQKLMPLAGELGSDVPFCLVGEPAWVSGRGGEVQPLARPLPALWALLILPPVAVSTGEVYGRLDELRLRQTKITTFTRKHRLGGLELVNDLEGPALEICPDLGRLFRQLDQSLGVPRLMVAGSGSTLCAIFDDRDEAHLWLDRTRADVKCPASVVAVRRGSAAGAPDP